MRWSDAELALYQARRHQNAPPAASGGRRRVNRAAGHPTEGQDHLAVVEHLKARCGDQVHWHHPATGEIRDAVTAAKLKRMGVRAGLPDFLLVIGGRLHGLELKRQRGGRVSLDQRAMHDELVTAGAIVAVARGLDDALAILEQWGAFKSTRERVKA